MKKHLLFVFIYFICDYSAAQGVIFMDTIINLKGKAIKVHLKDYSKDIDSDQVVLSFPLLGKSDTVLLSKGYKPISYNIPCGESELIVSELPRKQHNSCELWFENVIAPTHSPVTIFKRKINMDGKKLKFKFVYNENECKDLAKVIQKEKETYDVVKGYFERVFEERDVSEKSKEKVKKALEAHWRKRINPDKIDKGNGKPTPLSIKKAFSEYVTIMDTCLLANEYDRVFDDCDDIDWISDHDFTNILKGGKGIPSPSHPMDSLLSDTSNLVFDIKFKLAEWNIFKDEIAAEREIKKIADYMLINTDTDVRIIGHTDCTNEGKNEQKHKKLSEQRAGKVKEILKAFKISGERIHIVGKGGTEPIVPCNENELVEHDENPRIEARFGNPELVSEIVQKKSNDNELVTAKPVNLRLEKNLKVDKVICVVPTGARCTIIKKAEKITPLKLTAKKVLDFWYKVRYEAEDEVKEGWIFGYFTNKQLEPVLIAGDYRVKEDGIKSLLDYANKQCANCYAITEEWLRLTNPNSFKDKKVSKGEGFLIKAFKER